MLKPYQAGAAGKPSAQEVPLQYTKEPFKEMVAPRKIQSIRFGLQSSQEVVRTRSITRAPVAAERGRAVTAGGSRCCSAHTRRRVVRLLSHAQHPARGVLGLDHSNHPHLRSSTQMPHAG